MKRPSLVVSRTRRSNWMEFAHPDPLARVEGRVRTALVDTTSSYEFNSFHWLCGCRNIEQTLSNSSNSKSRVSQLTSTLPNEQGSAQKLSAQYKPCACCHAEAFHSMAYMKLIWYRRAVLRAIRVYINLNENVGNREACPPPCHTKRLLSPKTHFLFAQSSLRQFLYPS